MLTTRAAVMAALPKLADPFEAHDLEWKPQRTGLSNDGKPWAQLAPYLTSRAIMHRLDSVLGPAGWHNEFRPTPGHGDGILCGISVWLPSDETHAAEWVTKWDGSGAMEPNDGLSAADATKGTLSASLKRCAVLWGIGRDLYEMDTHWAEFREGAPHRIKIKGTLFHYDTPRVGSNGQQARPSQANGTTPRTVARDDAPSPASERPTPPRNGASTRSRDNGRTDPADMQVPFGKTKGTRLGDLPSDELLSLAEWCESKGKFEDLARACRSLLAAQEFATAGADDDAPHPALDESDTDDLPF